MYPPTHKCSSSAWIGGLHCPSPEFPRSDSRQRVIDLPIRTRRSGDQSRECSSPRRQRPSGPSTPGRTVSIKQHNEWVASDRCYFRETFTTLLVRKITHAEGVHHSNFDSVTQFPKERLGTPEGNKAFCVLDILHRDELECAMGPSSDIRVGRPRNQ